MAETEKTSKTIIGRKKITEWEAFCRERITKENQVDSSKSWAIVWMWISALASIASLFFLIELLFISIPIFIYFFLKNRNLNKQKEQTLAPRFNTQLLPFLLYLKDEIHPLMPIQLNINIEPYKNTPSKTLNAGVKGYEQTWLKGKTRLLDGSFVSFVFHDKIRDLTITKRGSVSGKTKTKYKTKIKTVFKVKFSADLSRFNKGTGIKVFKLKGAQKTKTSMPMFRAADFARVFIPAYKELYSSGNSAPIEDNYENKRTN